MTLHALSPAPGADSAPLPVGPGFRAGLSLAAAGDMALSRRAAAPYHAAYLARHGAPPLVPCALRQVHSRQVICIDAADGPGTGGAGLVEADGMVTARDDLLLTVTVADCLPLILVDMATGAFGLVHSGWKGTGIVVEAIRLMGERFGTRARDLRVTIGPGIGPCCYTVPRDRADGFAASFGASSVVGEERPRLDLRAANVTLLQRAGVRDITVVRECTSCTPSLGSFRRQGPEAYTLMLAWVGRSLS